MARELRRLLLAPSQLAASVDGVLTLTPEHSHYLTKVLRYGLGAHFAVVDGIGHLWQAELLDRNQARLLQPFDQPLQRQPAARPQLVLAAAVVKRDFDLVVRMAVELGVDRFVPLLCERTAVLGHLREERWHTIAAEAAEQCERLWMPRIDPPTQLKTLLLEAEGGSRLWATTRNGELPSPAAALAHHHSGDVWLACGPEGGWSDVEERQAAEAGWIAVQLGATILRSSTACVAGTSLISSWRSAR